MAVVVAGALPGLIPLAAVPAVPSPAGAGSDWAAGTSATVGTGGPALTVRSGPAGDRDGIGALAEGSTVTVLCQVWGEQLANAMPAGGRRTTPLWDRLGAGRYVSDAFVTWLPARPEVPWCGAEQGGATSASVATDGSTLRVRSGPGTGAPVVGAVPFGAGLPVQCQAWGEKVAGATVSPLWLRVGVDRFVSAAFVAWSAQYPRLPWCGQEPPAGPPASSGEFITRAAVLAQAGQRDHRVPASVTIAQAILESGWGRSALTRNDHNVFGTTCAGEPGPEVLGPVALGCRQYSGHECAGTGCHQALTEFRAYRSVEDSYADHARQLAETPRYAEAMAHAGEPDVFVREIHKAGYAAGTAYADKVIGLMRQYDLYRYDARP